MNKQQQWNIWYFVAALLLLMLFQSVWTTYRTVEPIPYSDFVKFLNEGRIVDVTVHQERITGRLKEPINGRELFVTNRVDPALAEQIGKSGVKFTGTVENTFLSTLLSHAYTVSSGCVNQRHRRVSSISDRMVSGCLATSRSMTRAAMRPQASGQPRFARAPSENPSQAADGPTRYGRTGFEAHQR